MLSDFLFIGDSEVINTARLQAYLTNVGSPFTSGRQICNCPTVTPAMLGDTAYTTPSDVANPAPWYDADVPVSGEFLGFLPLSITGINDNPRTRSVTASVQGGGYFGASRVQPRTMVVTGLLLGSSCCGAEYGMQYITEVLSGCTGNACDGDCVTMFDCCPDAPMTEAAFNAAHRRSFRRVALTSGPVELDRQGNGAACSRGTCGGGDIIRVEFTLVAATPWIYGEQTPVLDVPLPVDAAACIAWCLHSPGASTCQNCRFAGCDTGEDSCADPAFPIPSPPVPASPATAFCSALSTARSCYSIDLSARPQWAADVPTITVYSGSSAMRQVTISIYAKTAEYSDFDCSQLADLKHCDPAAVFEIQYLPQRTTLTLDGEIGRVLQNCDGVCNTATTVYGADGGAISWPLLDCDEYCVCIETNSILPPASDATVSMVIAGRVG